MKRFILILLLVLLAPQAWAQCNGIFPPGQVCGNTSAVPAVPQAGNLGAIISSSAIRVPTRSSTGPTVSASPVTDYFLCLDSTSNAITVNLPASPGLGLTFLIKDCTGQAAAHNITIVPASGNIDGSVSFIMSGPYQSTAVTFSGLQWSIN